MFDRPFPDVRRPRAQGPASGHPDRGEAKFRALLESAPDAIVVTDGEGRIVIVNARVEELFGYRREELLGRSVAVLVPESLRERHAVHQVRYAADPTSRPMGAGRELEARRKDGSRFPVEVGLSPLKLDDGSLLVTAIVRDVTERRALEGERRRLTEERAARLAAEAASRAKDEFLATVSHELRTPLAAMLGWAVLVHENPGNAEILSRAIPAIERNVQIQRRLVEDLLDGARIATGTLRVDMVPVDVAPVLEAALDAVRPAAAAKDVRLESHLDVAGSQVMGDASRLQQVFWNLLSNGVKFTPAGGRILLSARCAPSQIEVVVEDTGQGVSKEFLPHVFERLRRELGPSTPAGSGLGLGLAIAKDLVERHGGTIVAESDGRDRGSRFVVRLPVAAAVRADLS